MQINVGDMIVLRLYESQINEFYRVSASRYDNADLYVVIIASLPTKYCFTPHPLCLTTCGYVHIFSTSDIITHVAC